MQENEVKLPSICVPIIGESQEQINLEAEFAEHKGADIVEWRADYFNQILDEEKVIETLQLIRKKLSKQAILFTLRSEKEGGNSNHMSNDFKLDLYKNVCRSGYVDYIDTELCNGEEQLFQLKNEAKVNNVKVILSFHDFEKTPGREELINKAEKANELQADYFKFAVMSLTRNNSLSVFQVTEEISDFIQPISMAMGVFGKMTRAASWAFGSKITYAQGLNSSAPGQMTVDELRASLKHIERLV